MVLREKQGTVPGGLHALEKTASAIYVLHKPFSLSERESREQGAFNSLAEDRGEMCVKN